MEILNFSDALIARLAEFINEVNNGKHNLPNLGRERTYSEWLRSFNNWCSEKGYTHFYHSKIVEKD